MSPFHVCPISWPSRLQDTTWSANQRSLLNLWPGDLSPCAISWSYRLIDGCLQSLDRRPTHRPADHPSVVSIGNLHLDRLLYARLTPYVAAYNTDWPTDARWPFGRRARSTSFSCSSSSWTGSSVKQTTARGSQQSETHRREKDKQQSNFHENLLLIDKTRVNIITCHFKKRSTLGFNRIGGIQGSGCVVKRCRCYTAIPSSIYD